MILNLRHRASVLWASSEVKEPGIMHDGFSATLEELCCLEIPLFGAPEALEGEQKSRATIEGCVGNRESNSRPRQVTATYNIANSI